MKKIITLFIIFVVILSCFAGCSEKSDQGLKVGVLFPLTGDAASYGEKGKRGIELALKRIKQKDADTKVTIIYEDSRAEAKTGVTAMRKLVDIDHVPVVIGDIVSAVTLPAAAVAEKNHVVLLSPTSSAPAITHAGEYIFRIWPSDLAEGKAIADFAISTGFRRAAILHLNNDYGLAIADIFKTTFKEKGGTIVLCEGYLKDNKDFRSLLTKVNQAKVETIYVAGYYADTARVLRQAHELGIESQFLGTTAIEDEKFLEIAGNAAEGIIYPLATGFDTQSDKPLVKEFVETFEKNYGYKPGWVEAQSYDALMLVNTAAAPVAKQIIGEKIKRYLDSMGQYEGITGIIEFDKNGDVVKPVRFKTVKSDRFQNIGL